MALRSVGEATVMESIKTLVFSLQDELGELNDQEQMLTKQVNNVHDTIECGAQGACSIIIRLYWTWLCDCLGNFEPQCRCNGLLQNGKC